MRIALIVPGGVDRSGEYRVIPALLALVRRLALRHEVHVFALSQEAAPGEWTLGGASVHNIGSRHTVVRAIGAVRSMHRQVGFDVIHAIWSGACGTVAVVAAKILRRPSLVHVAGGELVALPDIRYGGRLRWRGRAREALILRSASAVTAASDPMIEMIASVGVHARRVPLGVDLEVWPARDPVPRDVVKPIRLIHLASLNPVKDQTTLLHALAVVARSGVSFEMDIIGEDILRGAMQGLAGRLGLAERVHFRGFMPQRTLRAFVEAADLMLLSSRHEAGPLAVLEAAVAGVPTVGTTVGHLAEWSADAALTVPVRDSGALAQAILQVVGDESLRLRLARRAHQLAVQEDAAYTVSCFEQVYASVATRGHRL